MHSPARASWRLVPLALVGLFLPRGARAQADLQAQPSAWVDPSAHAVLGIAVEPQVRLEVLDWGGTGDAMVFLAGLSNTAHSFDEFAQRFLDAFHVYAITRRGFGASSHPGGGYDSATRARDLLAVLDSLGIHRAILVGHSIAGDELSRFAVDYPDRVRALVYLDAYSYGPDAETPTHPPYPPQAVPPITPADSASLESVSDYLERRYGVSPPEAELRAVSRFASSGRLELYPLPDARARVYAGTERSDYARIQAPALAIFATHASARHLFPAFGALDARNRAMAQAYFASVQAWQAAQIARFRAELPRATVVEIPDANHFVHYSHPDVVERDMRAFLADVPR